MSFFSIFEVHEELSKIIRDPFKGFVLVSENGFLVDTSFEREEETDAAVMVANWIKIALDRVRSELKLKSSRVSVALSLGSTSYFFRQLGGELYVVFVLDGDVAPPVLGREEELALQKVECLVEGKPVAEAEAAAAEPPAMPLTGRMGDPYEVAETALKLFRDAVSRIESSLKGGTMLDELKMLASAAQRLEGALSAFKKTLGQLESYSRDIARLSELTSSLTSAIDTMNSYSGKLLDMLGKVRETIISSQASMKPSIVEETINRLRAGIEAASSPGEATSLLSEALDSLVKSIGYIHPALFEMKSYCRLFKEASPREYEMLKKEFLSSIDRWRMRLVSVEKVFSS